MSGAAGKLRVLVLHGYASNPLAYARRVSALTKACSGVAEFVFAPAPHQVRSLPSETNPEPGPVDPSLPLEKQARAWFMANEETGVYEGWAHTAHFLRDYFREHGPFDGILGFSQGACLTGMLAAALEHPDRVPALDTPLQEAPLRFAIAVSGFKPRDPAFAPLYEVPIQVPVLHVLGRSDAVVDFERSKPLLEHCVNARVVYHDGGHYLPTPAPWRHFVRAFLESFRSEDHDAWRTVPEPGEERAENKM